MDKVRRFGLTNPLAEFSAVPAWNPHYVDKTVDYEALMVARNAPRWLQMLVKHGFVPAPA